MSRNPVWGRLALLSPGTREPRPGYDFASNVMHVDGDDICPKCLGWISATAIVRRTAYGLVQHEACPRRTASAETLSTI